MSTLTPMMRQYLRIKEEHRDAILLYHMGDFYEMFYEDAEVAARILNIALTTRDRQRADPVPLCGIPCHAADSYISKLLEHGLKVAVCDQVEDAAAAQGLVRREVTKVITPGTVLDDRLLEGKSNNFLLSLFPGRSLCGLAAADLSTGEFFVFETARSNMQELEDRVTFFSPMEILLPDSDGNDIAELLARAAPRAGAPSPGNPGTFDPDLAEERVLKHFDVSSLDVFGCEHMTAGITAAGALLSYLQENQRRPLANLVTLVPFTPGGSLIIDSSSQRNLELVASLETGRRGGSLLSILDRTATSMGGRKLRSWLLSPLTDGDAIDERLDAVGELLKDGPLRNRLAGLLREIYDLERLSSRISLNSCTPRDLSALRGSLRVLPELPEILAPLPAPLFANLSSLDLLPDLLERLEEQLSEDPPAKIKDGGLIRPGFSSELDDLKAVSSDARAWLSDYEQKERERTGISSLKVGYNKVHGYFIEITRANIGNVPGDYSRKQTLVNAERFHTSQLAEFENRILTAEDRTAALEQELFEALRRSLAAEAGRIQMSAAAVATIDVLLSLSTVALEKNFCRPEIDNGRSLRIIEGRHPVVEEAGTERFVPNDCLLDSAGCQIMIITGPNMAGKSTFLRQVALITLMAQMGSYVPAREATVGIVDRVFTRIGAADRLSRGQSTFMVEMVETASILRHATDRSLVVLDEIGRGTSTFDGLSIAWAVVETLHGTASAGPKTIFATHYHHLTELPLTLNRARNFNIAVQEWEGKILFLRKIVEGGTDKSYGIHVAQLAGLPAATVDRARVLLQNLEEGELNLEGLPQIAQITPAVPPPSTLQMEIFPSAGEKICRRLEGIDLEGTTPLEALGLLADLKEDIEKDREKR